MKNISSWRPTKYILRSGRLTASRDPNEVLTASRLIADLVGTFYSNAVPMFANGSLLDLGCGKAPMYGLYSKYADPITLVDWANSIHENPHLDLIADLNLPLALPSGGYSTVILSDVLEHIKRPQNLMDEISRVLAPGGVLLANTPFLYGLHEQPHDYYRYTEYALIDIAERAGLEILEISPLGGGFEVMTDLASKLAMRAPQFSSGLATLVQYVGNRLSATNFGKKVRLSSEYSFPLGYSMVARKPDARIVSNELSPE